MQVFYSSFSLLFRSSETFYITQKKNPIFLPFFWHIHAHCTCTRIHSYLTIATHKTGSFRAILFCFAFSWNWCRCIRCMAYMKKIELSWAFVAYPIDFCRSNILLFFCLSRSFSQNISCVVLLSFLFLVHSIDNKSISNISRCNSIGFFLSEFFLYNIWKLKEKQKKNIIFAVMIIWAQTLE